MHGGQTESRVQQAELNKVKDLNKDQAKHVFKASQLKDSAEIQEECAQQEREAFELDVMKTKTTFKAYEKHFANLGQTIQLARERAEQYAIARNKKNAEFSSKAAKKLSEKYRFMEEAMAQQVRAPA